ncbi:MAG TPA: hypothetical protein VH593_07640 [Ktedonobacteraceae bacterium]
MAVLYTPKEIQDVLRELRIKPVDGNKVTGKEAARILTWRAKAEQGIEHTYPDSAIRRHVERGNLKIAEQVNPRFNLYKVEDIFDLPLVPRRGISQQSEEQDDIEPAA